ncbi:kinase-like domain-containing protein [Fimicolochytrium jonesii]|uniref:kinase-like domain-containing protein n=1 Tax=Fimicolochytrium jonesii TaxID=1396493 RepID=UPI0022FDCBBE|nr:kinase-like domain-containing protein [Fimicolochytrium jonesii]KAI8820164.1 kinase-like domain-containing protein [Fimicolochytrium jonesii]
MSSLRGGALKGTTVNDNNKQHHNSPVQLAGDNADEEEGLHPFELSEEDYADPYTSNGDHDHHLTGTSPGSSPEKHPRAGSSRRRRSRTPKGPASAAMIRRQTSLRRRMHHEEERRTRQGRLLLVSMLENFCALYDESPERNRRLFYVICKQLASMGIIEAHDFLDELASVRGAYKRAFRDLVIRAMDAIKEQEGPSALPFEAKEFDRVQHPNGGGGGKSPLMSTRQADNLDGTRCVSPLMPRDSNFTRNRRVQLTHRSPSVWDAHASRYSEDFEEMNVLGRGAFGRVYRVRNRLDGIEYAVKKVRLKLGTNTLERILREVKFQAKLHHPNVVRYFSAWVEDIAEHSTHRGVPDGAGVKQDTGQHPDDHFQSDFETASRTVDTLPSNIPYRSSTTEDRWTDSRITEVLTSDSDLGLAPSGDEDSLDIVFAEEAEPVIDDTTGTPSPDVFTESSEDWSTSASNSHNEATATPKKSFFRKPSQVPHTPENEEDNDVNDENGHYQEETNPRRTFNDISTLPAAIKSLVSRNLSTPLLATSPPLSLPTLPYDVNLTLLIQMELCSHTLQDHLRKRNALLASDPSQTLDVDEARWIFRDLVEGLLYVHSMGCIHRDIKPKNIYWKERHGVGRGDGRGGVWKIGDFGLVTASELNDDTQCESGGESGKETPVGSPASVESLDKWRAGTPKAGVGSSEGVNRRRQSSSRTSKRSKNGSDRTAGVGTFTYASPEQLHPSPTTPYTPASDIYSLGIILFELLNPFSTQMERAQHLAHLRSGVFPKGFEARFPVETGWMRSMMGGRPGGRPGAAELLVWVDEPVVGGGCQTPIGSPTDQTTPTADSFAKIPTSTPTTTATTTTTTTPALSSAGLQVTLTPPIPIPVPIQDDGLAEQNRALRVRVEELERRLAGMGVDV